MTQDSLIQLLAQSTDLAERMRGIEARHEALVARNGQLLAAIKIARTIAATSAAQPYYLGTGHDAGAHWGEALNRIVELLAKAEGL